MALGRWNITVFWDNGLASKGIIPSLKHIAGYLKSVKEPQVNVVAIEINPVTAYKPLT